MSDFRPCSEHCPAVTGKPYGDVAYCPKVENERHKTFMADHPGLGVHSNNRDGTHTTLDWRTNEMVVVVGTDEGWKPEIPPHPDETNCCLDFGCCPDAFAGELGGIFAAMVTGREGGEAVVHVKPAKARGDA
jgi:hypothetical protein